MKINFNFNLTGIIVFLLVILFFILVILKAIGISTISWLQTLVPLGVVCVLFFFPALIIFIWDKYFS